MSPINGSCGRVVVEKYDSARLREFHRLHLNGWEQVLEGSNKKLYLSFFTTKIVEDEQRGRNEFAPWRAWPPRTGLDILGESILVNSECQCWTSRRTKDAQVRASVSLTKDQEVSDTNGTSHGDEIFEFVIGSFSKSGSCVGFHHLSCVLD